MDLSIIIVNYNTTHHLKKCLDSIYGYTSKLRYEVIIVDNNSPEREIEKLQLLYSHAQFLFRAVNEGFGAGCNYGCRHACGKYLLFINPDVILLNNVIHELFEFMEKNLEVAVASPIYIENDGYLTEIYSHFPGFIQEFNKAFGTGFITHNSRPLPNKGKQSKTQFEVDWVMGSFMFVRTDVFKHVGGFDENFFLYYEDIDLQYAIRNLGYKILYYSSSVVRHLKRSSIRTYNGENLYYYHMTRSNLIYMHKHFGFLKRNSIRMLYLTGISLRIMSLPLRKKFRGKRKQKLFQYIRNLRQYFSVSNSIYNSKSFRSDSWDSNRRQLVDRDGFWKID